MNAHCFALCHNIARSTNRRKCLHHCDKDAASLPFEDLLKKCEVFSSSLKMSPEVKIIEKQTRQQSTSKEWKIQRIGKITASKARVVCVANIENPGMSTVQEIC